MSSKNKTILKSKLNEPSKKKDKIKSVKSIQQVTGAMKMVAAAKMRRAQENMEKARPYSSRLSEILVSLNPDGTITISDNGWGITV